MSKTHLEGFESTIIFSFIQHQKRILKRDVLNINKAPFSITYMNVYDTTNDANVTDNVFLLLKLALFPPESKIFQCNLKFKRLRHMDMKT